MIVREQAFGSILDDFFNFVKNPQAVKDAAQAAIDAVKDPNGTIESVTIETTWLPTINIVKPLADGGGGPDPLAKFLKPKLTVRPRGLTPYILAPYGEPGPTNWPYVEAGLAVGGVALAWLLFRGITK